MCRDPGFIPENLVSSRPVVWMAKKVSNCISKQGHLSLLLTVSVNCGGSGAGVAGPATGSRVFCGSSLRTLGSS